MTDVESKDIIGAGSLAVRRGPVPVPRRTPRRTPRPSTPPRRRRLWRPRRSRRLGGGPASVSTASTATVSSARTSSAVTSGGPRRRTPRRQRRRRKRLLEQRPSPVRRCPSRPPAERRSRSAPRPEDRGGGLAPERRRHRRRTHIEVTGDRTHAGVAPRTGRRTRTASTGCASGAQGLEHGHLEIVAPLAGASWAGKSNAGSRNPRERPARAGASVPVSYGVGHSKADDSSAALEHGGLRRPGGLRRRSRPRLEPRRRRPDGRRRGLGDDGDRRRRRRLRTSRPVRRRRGTRRARRPGAHRARRTTCGDGAAGSACGGERRLRRGAGENLAQDPGERLVRVSLGEGGAQHLGDRLLAGGDRGGTTSGSAAQVGTSAVCVSRGGRCDDLISHRFLLLARRGRRHRCSLHVRSGPGRPGSAVPRRIARVNEHSSTACRTSRSPPPSARARR